MAWLGLGGRLQDGEATSVPVGALAILLLVCGCGAAIGFGCYSPLRMRLRRRHHVRIGADESKEAHYNKTYDKKIASGDLMPLSHETNGEVDGVDGEVNGETVGVIDLDAPTAEEQVAPADPQFASAQPLAGLHETGDRNGIELDALSCPPPGGSPAADASTLVPTADVSALPVWSDMPVQGLPADAASPTDLPGLVPPSPHPTIPQAVPPVLPPPPVAPLVTPPPPGATIVASPASEPPASLQQAAPPEVSPLASQPETSHGVPQEAQPASLLAAPQALMEGPAALSAQMPTLPLLTPPPQSALSLQPSQPPQPPQLQLPAQPFAPQESQSLQTHETPSINLDQVASAVAPSTGVGTATSSTTVAPMPAVVERVSAETVLVSSCDEPGVTPAAVTSSPGAVSATPSKVDRGSGPLPDTAAPPAPTAPAPQVARLPATTTATGTPSVLASATDGATLADSDPAAMSENVPARWLVAAVENVVDCALSSSSAPPAGPVDLLEAQPEEEFDI